MKRMSQNNKWHCFVCGRPVHRQAGAIRSHLRRHISEGVLRHSKDAAKLRRTGNNWFTLEFNINPKSKWAWVEKTTPEIIAIKPHIGETLYLARFQVGGITEIGDAVRVDYTGRGRDINLRDGGMWFAMPLGYKADWKVKHE